MAEGSDRSDEIRGATQGEDVRGPAPAVSEELKERARSGEARADITETVDAIQDKLEPQNLEKQAKARATEAARARGQQVFETVRQNPMPAAVAGGVLCLLLARRIIRGRG